MRGVNLLRQGYSEKQEKQVIHLLGVICTDHHLTIRSSYSAELLAGVHGFEDAYPLLVTLNEIYHGVLPQGMNTPRHEANLRYRAILTTDAESMYKSLTSREQKTPAEHTLLGHVSMLREMLRIGLLQKVQWCDTKDMTADGHTKGSVDRTLLKQVMEGQQEFEYDIQSYTSHPT